MSAEKEQGFIDYLLLNKPASVLLVGEALSVLATELETHVTCPKVYKAHNESVEKVLKTHPRFDLLVVHQYLESLSLIEGRQFLAKMRDRHAKRLVVFYDAQLQAKNNCPQLDRLAFFSLGFKSPEGIAQAKTSSTLYEYSLKDYKTVPDWLNARFWANPERWNKYRW
jgi:hypothetical protein